MRKPLWLVAWILVIELVVILLLVPGGWTERTIQKESELIESNLGSQARKWIYEKADDWYQAAMIDSGFYEGMYYTFIPTAEQKEGARGMEKMGSWWFNWLEGRIQSFSDVVYQFMARAALLWVWAPYMLLLLVPAIYDGAMTRNIKRTNFDYASPVLHRYSTRFAGHLLIGMLIAFFAPVALNPVFIPIILMICCVLLGVMVGNLQKRI